MWDRELERFYFYIMGYGPSFMLLVLCPLNKRYIESNTSKSARQGNLRHLRVIFQSFADSAILVSERLNSYPRLSEISLSCTFCRCLILFLTFISCFQFRVCLCTFNRRSCKQYELFPLHVNQKISSVFLCIA